MIKTPDSKTQPASTGQGDNYSGNWNGTPSHDHNYKGRSINTEGSDYNDLGRKSSGLHGNFAEKDASMEYLRERNKQGQSVANFSGTERQSRIHTQGGGTAYNGMPIPEVYKPATSQGNCLPNAVEYKTEKKDRNMSNGYETDSESNKLMGKMVKNLKAK
jgi:hypothetical protein